ncbi:MAG: Phosphoglycolate phosphatase [Acidobacteria bacterium]|nr:Phosphoglycolate phosphatase [Acidobacteriota bacterium]
MHCEAILFDVDGTLVDSNELHVDCWLEAFAKFGKELPREVIRSQIGKGGDLLVPDLLSAREMRTFGKQLQEYRSNRFKEQYLSRVKPFPWVRECLERLRGLGLELALASSSDKEEVEYYTALLGVGDLLAGTTSKSDAEFSKPSPEIFRAALERTGSSEERTLSVGDTPYDILASHRIPLPIAAVLSGGFERETLVKAEFLFTDVQEMVRKIDEVDAYFIND